MGRRPPDSNFLHNSRGLNVRSLLSLCGAGILQHHLRLALFASAPRPAAPHRTQSTRSAAAPRPAAPAPIAAPSAGGPRLRLALFASAPRPADPAPIAAPSAGGPRCASSPRGRHAFRSDVLHHPRCIASCIQQHDFRGKCQTSIHPLHGPHRAMRRGPDLSLQATRPDLPQSREVEPSSTFGSSFVLSSFTHLGLSFKFFLLITHRPRWCRLVLTQDLVSTYCNFVLLLFHIITDRY